MSNKRVAGIVAGLLFMVACSESPLSEGQGSQRAEAAFSRSPVADGVAGNPRFVFDRLTGNARPFTGAANPIRGVNAGGLPWALDRGEARLDFNGELRVKVRGLTLDPADPVVISRGLAGVNPSAEFKAILSCLTVDGSGQAVTVNVETQPAPATTGLGGGDAEIRETLSGIPSPCIGPIVFVTSAGGSWFAASGF